jgi:hypothetical protein
MKILNSLSSISGLILLPVVTVLVLQTEPCAAWQRRSSVGFGGRSTTRTSTQPVVVRSETNGDSMEKILQAATNGVVETTADNFSRDEQLALRAACEATITLFSSDVGFFF